MPATLEFMMRPMSRMPPPKAGSLPGAPASFSEDRTSCAASAIGISNWDAVAATAALTSGALFVFALPARFEQLYTDPYNLGGGLDAETPRPSPWLENAMRLLLASTAPTEMTPS